LFGLGYLFLSVIVAVLEFLELLVVEIDWVGKEVHPRSFIILTRDYPSPVRWLKSDPELGRRALPVVKCLLYWRLSSSSE